MNFNRIFIHNLIAKTCIIVGQRSRQKNVFKKDIMYVEVSGNCWLNAILVKWKQEKNKTYITASLDPSPLIKD